MRTITITKTEYRSGVEAKRLNVLTSICTLGSLDDYVRAEWPGWTIYSVEFEKEGERWTYYPNMP